MIEQTIKRIEATIGYTFRNRTLLQQAFTRSSYAAEHGGQDNEVLEHIGDRILGWVVIDFLTAWHCRFDENGAFVSRYNAGELNDIQQKLVDGPTLAQCIETLGLHRYLIMGNGDKKQNVSEVESVKADLFEAIIAAVALDSKNDMAVLRSVVFKMLFQTILSAE